MTRQERFEAIWAREHAVTVESLQQYRWVTQDGYRLPDMAAHYRTFCHALDSVEIVLTNALHLNIAGELIEAYEISDLGKAFKAAGLKVAE
jgi:hypothetical protein